MLTYLSMFFMIFTCLIGVYTIADWISRQIYQHGAAKCKRAALFVVNSDCEELEVAVREAALREERVIIVLKSLSPDLVDRARVLAADYLNVYACMPQELQEYVESVAFATKTNGAR